MCYPERGAPKVLIWRLLGNTSMELNNCTFALVSLTQNIWVKFCKGKYQGAKKTKTQQTKKEPIIYKDRK